MEYNIIHQLYNHMKCNFIGHVIADKDKQTLDLQGENKLKIHCERCGVPSMLLKITKHKFKIYPIYDLPLK